LFPFFFPRSTIRFSSNRDLRRKRRRRRREISPLVGYTYGEEEGGGGPGLESADGIERVLWKIDYGRGKERDTGVGRKIYGGCLIVSWRLRMA